MEVGAPHPMAFYLVMALTLIAAAVIAFATVHCERRPLCPRFLRFGARDRWWMAVPLLLLGAELFLTLTHR